MSNAKILRTIPTYMHSEMYIVKNTLYELNIVSSKLISLFSVRTTMNAGLVKIIGIEMKLGFGDV